MYTGKNFNNKEDLEKAVKSGEKVTIFQPKWIRKVTQEKTPTRGIIPVMGPHIHFRTSSEDTIKECKQHSWFANAYVIDGVIVDVF